MKILDIERNTPSPARHINITKSAPGLLLISDFLALSVVVPFASHFFQVAESLMETRLILGISLVIWCLIHGHYHHRLRAAAEFAQLGRGLLLVAVADAIALHDVTGQWQWGWPAACWLPALLLLPALRHLTRRLLTRVNWWPYATLVISGGQAEMLTAALAADRSLGFRVEGVLDLTAGRLRCRGDGDQPVSDPEMVSRLFCLKHNIQMAVMDIEAAQEDSGRRIIRTLRAMDVEVSMASSLAEMPVVGLRAHNFFSHDVVLLTSGLGWSQPAMQAAKRLFDLMAAGLLLLLLSPLLLAVGCLVIRDGGPMTFGHTRIGQNGQSFKCLKFRSMVIDAEAVLQEVLARDPAKAEEWRRTLKLRDDPRITPIGRFLRSTSLDELPQLINVLRGEMSLVGPRPVTAGELDRYGREKDYYLAVRPGITGLWQVSGRNDTSYGHRTLLDAWYVRNWSLGHDMAILLMTIPAVLLRRGAY